jgi:DNA-binding transcriptional MerR regulator
LYIRELAKNTGASIRSLRYYEEAGLLKAERLANGYRIYDEPAINTVKKIQLYLNLGLGTAQIKGIMDCPTLQQLDRPLCVEAYTLYKQKLGEVQKQIELLQSVACRLQEKMDEFETKKLIKKR